MRVRIHLRMHTHTITHTHIHICTFTQICQSIFQSYVIFRGLCSLDIQLDQNLLTVVQCVIGGHPDLTPDLVDCTVRLLETGATLLAKNAKYGRLILNFVKAYRNQVYTSDGVYVPCI